MSKATILPSTFEFLKSLKKNNTRDWFNAHKERYLEELSGIEKFADALLLEMNKHDVIETPSGKKSLHRIYRDVRFSKEKTPYNTHWGGGFKRAGKTRRGSYYFHLSPGNSFVAGGFWGPEPADLKRIREEFSYDPATFRKILKSKSFITHFGNLLGEQIKTTPKGFDANDAAIDLLRYKQFLLKKSFSDTEVMAPDFFKKANETYKAMRPFLDYMSDALRMDMNGEAL
ncbi:TIGR02453 family protein [Sphingobacteriaceae bacterium]|nr:TIGR02453 family protein [Sphingobacteriaceae bacterium]